MSPASVRVRVPKVWWLISSWRPLIRQRDVFLLVFLEVGEIRAGDDETGIRIGAEIAEAGLHHLDDLALG